MSGFEIPFGVTPTVPCLVQGYSGPYEGATIEAAKAAALAGFPIALRRQTVQVNLIAGGQGYIYWFKDGVADGDLVEFVNGTAGETTVTRVADLTELAAIPLASRKKFMEVFVEDKGSWYVLAPASTAPGASEATVQNWMYAATFTEYQALLDSSIDTWGFTVKGFGCMLHFMDESLYSAFILSVPISPDYNGIIMFRNTTSACMVGETKYYPDDLVNEIPARVTIRNLFNVSYASYASVSANSEFATYAAAAGVADTFMSWRYQYEMPIGQLEEFAPYYYELTPFDLDTNPFPQKEPIITAFGRKVDKVTGKGLSTNDFTASYKTKLDGIAAGANNYVHPATHPATVIVQDANNRFVSDVEKANYIDKYTKSETDNLISNALTASDWKEAVATYADIATTYPTPEAGWTVNVVATNETYKYNGTAWVLFNSNTYEKATQAADGLMAKEDKAKLDGVEPGANVYVHPTSHPATMIAQDNDNQMVTLAQKNAFIHASHRYLDGGQITGSVIAAFEDCNVLEYEVVGNCIMSLSALPAGGAYHLLLKFSGDYTVEFSSDFYDLDPVSGINGDAVIVAGMSIGTRFYPVATKTFNPNTVTIATPSLVIGTIANNGDTVTVPITDSAGTATTMKILDTAQGASAPTEQQWAAATLMAFANSKVYTPTNNGDIRIYVRAFNSQGAVNTASGTVTVAMDIAPPVLTINSMTYSGLNITINTTDSAAVSSTMKIIAVAAGSAAPDESAWAVASPRTYAASTVFTAASYGNKDVYVRVFNTELEFDTEYSTINVLEVVAAPVLTITNLAISGNDVILTMTDSASTALTMKIIDVVSGANAPSELNWTSATSMAFVSPKTYTPAVGNRDVYVRVFNSQGAYDTKYAPTAVSDIYKLNFGNTESGFGTTALGWNNVNISNRPSAAMAILTSTGTDKGLKVEVPAEANCIYFQSGTVTGAISSNADFPSAVLAKAVMGYGPFESSPYRCVYKITGLVAGATYKARVVCMNDTAVSGKSSAESDFTRISLIGGTTHNLDINPTTNNCGELVLQATADGTGAIQLCWSGDVSWVWPVMNAAIFSKV